MNKEKVLKAKSIHIYGWSFLYNQKSWLGNNKRVENSFENLTKDIEKWGWKLKDFNQYSNGQEIYRENYMLKQYLRNSAKQIFFGAGSKETICNVYEFPFEDKEYIYWIKKEQNKYALPIEAIELHIYSCGVGILFIKALNNKYVNIEDIKAINDYGRRINVAYIPKSQDDGCIWADEIGIKVFSPSQEKEEYSVVMNYKELLEKLLKDESLENSLKRIEEPAEFLEAILYRELGSNGSKEPSKKRKKSKYVIESYSDDRMFLISMIRDSAIAKECQGLSEEYDFKEKEYKYAKKALEKIEDKIYSIIHADSKEATCQDGEMRREILKKTLYRRWLDEGSLFGVTSYSYVAITSDSKKINDIVVRPFYYEYLYIISLVLAQRIGLTRFSYETIKNAEAMKSSIGNLGEIIKIIPNFLKRLYKAGEHVKVQGRYVIFKSQMLVLEPSCQEQGIDIYKLLQEQLLVKEEQQVLEEQIQGLFESISAWRGNVWTRICMIGTLVVGIVEFKELVLKGNDALSFEEIIAGIIKNCLK